MEHKTFSDWRKHQNLKPLEFPNKEKFYFDLLNIEHSYSGRLDVAKTGNPFILEAEQLLINSIELFEMGYFDCAYYSLRSAIEVSTTMVFLSDLPNDEREKFLSSWKETKYFPMQNQMIKLLSEQGNVFVDMKEKMSDFFDFVKTINAELNKYVHKQGLPHFYTARNHPINSHHSNQNFIEQFEYYLKKCIGIVAIMRLAIDPFPVLLMEQNLLYRYSNSMTDPYNEYFVEEYIGEKYISEYKTTELYTSMYDLIMQKPIKNQATFDVIKHQLINTSKKDDILSQLSFLTNIDIVCSLLAFSSKKIVKIYCCGGFIMYFTDRNTNRKSWSWSSTDFNTFQKSKEKINNTYDEAYISIFTFEEETFFVEHNEQITVQEYSEIEKTISLKLKEIITQKD